MSQGYQDFFQSHQWTDGYFFIMAPPIPSHGSKECFPEAYFLLNLSGNFWQVIPKLQDKSHDFCLTTFLILAA